MFKQNFVILNHFQRLQRFSTRIFNALTKGLLFQTGYTNETKTFNIKTLGLQDLQQRNEWVSIIII